MSFSSALSSIAINPPELDHVVHLVKMGKLDDCIKLYRKLGFTVEKGGVHSDELTQNALIVLCDGVYIELIEFLDKPTKGSKETLTEFRDRRSKHWWWGNRTGWVDWCLKGGVKDTRATSINKASLLANQRHTDERSPKPDLVQYIEPVSGGRRALSGKDLKWKVTFPSGDRSRRGRYPFWCEDETPREWRVAQNTCKHPNHTQGLAALTLLYYPETFPSRLASLQLILASSSPTAEEMLACLVDMDPPPITEGKPALPSELVELYLSTPDGPLLPLRVKAAEDPDELQWLQNNGEGLWEVEISVASEKLPPSAPPDGVERETFTMQYGRIRLHPIHVSSP